MPTPNKLYKTTIVIWSEEDPEELELTDLAHDASDGGSYCSQQTTEIITDKEQFPKTEFFDVP